MLRPPFNKMIINDAYDSYLAFIDEYIYYLCNRCATAERRRHHHNNQLPHHDGMILRFFEPTRSVSLSSVTNFYNDIEHGLFHGIATAYVTWLFAQGKGNTAFLLASATLHDFAKTNGAPQPVHDKLLNQYYNNLHPAVYNHLTNNKSIISKADIAELTRYPDYKKWVDNRYYDVVSQIAEHDRLILDQYYNTIRPCLLYLFMHRDEVFIRHGLEIPEKMNYTRGTIFPPPATIIDIRKTMWGSKFRDRSVDGMYAVEIDHYPFGIPGNRLLSHCSNHHYGGNAFGNEIPTYFGKIKGYIAQSDFAHKNGRVHRLETRDHLYATSELACEDWVYLYTNIDDNDEQIRTIQNNSLLIIPQKLVLAQYNLIQLIFNRLRVWCTR